MLPANRATNNSLKGDGYLLSAALTCSNDLAECTPRPLINIVSKATARIQPVDDQHGLPVQCNNTESDAVVVKFNALVSTAVVRLQGVAKVDLTDFQRVYHLLCPVFKFIGTVAWNCLRPFGYMILAVLWIVFCPVLLIMGIADSLHC